MNEPDGPIFLIRPFCRKKSNRLGSLSTVLIEMCKFDPVVEEPQKTSVRLVNPSAFAGIVTRKIALILNLKSFTPIQDGRILRGEHVSANRFHQEVKLTPPADIDPVRLGWLKSKGEMGGSSS